MAMQERRNNWQEIESKKVSVLHLHLRKYNKCQSWCSPSQSILSLPLLLQPTKFYQMIKVEEFRLCCLPPPFPARDWVSPRLHLLFDLWQPLQSSSDHCRYRRRLMLTRRYPIVFLKNIFYVIKNFWNFPTIRSFFNKISRIRLVRGLTCWIEKHDHRR